MFFGGERFLEGISGEANVSAFELQDCFSFQFLLNFPLCVLGLHIALNIRSQSNEQSKTILLGLKFSCILLKLSVLP